MGVANIAVSALGLRATSTSSDGLLELFLNWVVPIGVLWFMLKFTASYPDKVTGGDRSTGDGHPAGDPAAPAPATAQRG